MEIEEFEAVRSLYAEDTPQSQSKIILVGEYSDIMEEAAPMVPIKYPQKISAISFDLFETLVHFWPPREEVQRNACVEFGISLDTDGIILGYTWADRLMASENAGLIPIRLRDKESRAEFFAEYQRLILLGCGVEVNSNLAKEIWDRVSIVPTKLALFDDVIPVLTVLQSKGISSGIISNYNQSGTSLLKELGLTALMDFAVTAQEVGAEKPDPKIFNAALIRSGVDPSEMIYVGDQYITDVIGAETAGIHGILIDRNQTANVPDEVIKIDGLKEVLGLLDSISLK